MKKKSLTDKSGEVRELSREDMRHMKSASEVLPPELQKVLPKVAQRGPQKAPTKVLVSLRYSPEVIQYFRETGEGWQARMDAALKEWIKSIHRFQRAISPGCKRIVCFIQLQLRKFHFSR